MTLRLGNKKVCPTKLVYVDKSPQANIVKYGNLNESKELLLSDFSNSNYAKTTIPSLGNKSWELECEFTIDDPTIDQEIIGISTRGASPFYIISGYFRFYLSSNGTSWDINAGDNYLLAQSGMTYHLKCSFNGTTYNISRYLNGSWQSLITQNSSTPINSDGNLWIGINQRGSSPKWFLQGSMNLSKCSLKIDGETVWRGTTEGIAPPIIYLMPNYTKTGSFTDNAGVVKTYGAAGYPTSTVMTPSSGTYEINVNFTTPTVIVSDSPLIQINNGDVFVNSSMHLCGWTGSTWAGGSTTLSYDKNYSFKFIRSDSETTVYLKEGLPSDTLTDYTQEYTITNYSDNSYIKFLVYGTNQFWPGTIDMKYCSLKQNNNILWEGCAKTIIR